jgi:multidrug efflux system membrane fusion protein
MRSIQPLRLALFAGVLCVLSAGCANKESASAKAPAPAVPVTIADVQQKSVPLEIGSIGNVESINTVNVKSLIAGEIVDVHFKEGDEVKKGDLLFQIDPRQSEADLAKAESTLKRDQAQALNARAQADRYSKLMQAGVVSKEQTEQFVSAAEAADASAAADKAAVDYARLQVTYTKIYSPISGRTGNLMVNRGNLVKANDTPALVTINQLTPIYVTFNIPQQQLAEVKKFSANHSLQVQARLKDSGEKAEGQLTFMDNAVDLTTGTIKLKGTFTNNDHKLWPGQFADVTLVLATEPNSIVVPSQAVQTGQKGQFVFVLKADNTVDLRPVTVKRTVGNESVIESGLQAGEKVVTDGQLRLKPDSKVEVKPATASTSQPTNPNFPAAGAQ